MREYIPEATARLPPPVFKMSSRLNSQALGFSRAVVAIIKNFLRFT
jgi:hypothetical protein